MAEIILRSCSACDHEWVARSPKPPGKCPRCQARYDPANDELVSTSRG